MTQRVRFLERLRLALHSNVDKIIDSINQPNKADSKGFIATLKINLEKLQNQIKDDD
jgi:plasmid replication initiation protein